MAEIATSKSISMTYTGGIPDGTGKLTDEIKIEGNMKWLNVSLDIQYDTDATTAPTAPTTFVTQDRILGIFNEFRFKIDGKEFANFLGRDIRKIVSLYFEDDDYLIDNLTIETNMSNQHAYANFKIPISKLKSVKEIDYDISFQPDSILSANDKYNVDSVSISFTPEYDEIEGETIIVYKNEIINGLDDYDINRNLGNLFAVIIDGYDSGIGETLTDLRFHYDRIPLIDCTFKEYQGYNRKNTHGVVDYSSYPNNIIYKFENTLDVTDLNKSMLSKLKTNAETDFTVTQIFIDKINPEVIPVMPEYNPSDAHKTQNTAPVDTAPKTSSPLTSSTVMGFRVKK